MLPEAIAFEKDWGNSGGLEQDDKRTVPKSQFTFAQLLTMLKVSQILNLILTTQTDQNMSEKHKIVCFGRLLPFHIPDATKTALLSPA